MVYLDYSATTQASDEVISAFINASKFGANPNSTHKAGKDANALITKSLDNIAKSLNLVDFDIIITSGASESNNTIIKGVVEKNNIKKIITTKLEHSSIIAPVSYLMKKGIKVEFVPLKNGLVDINELSNMIEENTLVTICAVDSELGTKQNIEEIALMLKKYNNVYFHTDITQAVGKCNIELTNVDAASFSAHKIYGFKGIGALLIKKNLEIEPLIHGGKSITHYRSGTPQTELIVSLDVALTNIMSKINENYEYVKKLNLYLVDKLKKFDNIEINSENNIPHILNFSILGKNSEETKQYFSDKDIYISSKTACSADTDLSKSVLEIAGKEENASSSIRVSLSYKTTTKEIDEFINILESYIGE